MKRQILFVFSILVFISGFVSIIEPDSAWVLKTGEWIIEHRQLPLQDVFSYTSQIPWLNHEWLSQILFWITYGIGGFWALSALQGLILLTLFVLALRATERKELIFDSWFIAIILWGLALLLLRDKLAIRAQLFTNLFLAISIWRISTFLQQPFQSRKSQINLLLSLLALGVFWTQLHGGAPHLALLSLIFWFCQRDKISFLAVIISIISTLIGPYGLSIHSHFGQSHDTLPQIREWHNLWEAFGFFPAYFVLSISLFALLAYSVIKKYPKNDRSTEFCLIVTGFFFLAALKYVRFFQEFLVSSLFVIPLVAIQLKAVGQKITRQSLRALAVIMLFSLFFMLGRREFGAGFSKEKFPFAAVDFIKSHQLSGPLFNSYNYGAFLIWSLPTEPVFIDGRAFTVYTEDQINELIQVYDDPSKFKQLEDRYGFRLAILQTNGRGQELPAYLLSNGWKTRFEDGKSIVLTKEQ